MLIAALLTTLPTFVATVGTAQEDGYIEDDPSAEKAKKKAKPSVEDAGAVREITRGVYAKANAGVAAYLGSFAQYVNSGTYVAIAVGQDFVDNEKQSMAWEIGLHQGLHNGVDYETQGDQGCMTLGTGTAPCLEGDLRTYTLTANYEISFYPTRRLGIGARVGGGALYSPLLMDAAAYQNDVVIGTYGAEPGLHNAIKPVVFAGPTIEYYTKLSHFSVGVDIDVFYAIGWDLGLNGSGSLKYTF